MEKQIPMKKSTKNLKYLLLILILIILFLIIQSTYSKYIETNTTPGKFNISEWNILINDINITETKVFTDNLKLEFNDDNENIAKGVAVPSSIGSFDIKINSTGTTVPFIYEVSIEDYNISSYSVEDFKIISYKVNNKAENKVETGKNSVSDTIDPAKNITDTVENTIKFKVQWYDVDSNTEGYNDPGTEKDILNNYEDAKKASKSTNETISDYHKEILIPVKVTVTQLPKDYKTTNTSI